MDAVAITIGVSWTVVGLLYIGLGVPLVRGRVGPNALYGVRFPQAFQSEDAWFAINRFGGRRLIAWAIPIVTIGIACFFLPLQSHTGLTLTLGFTPLIFVLIPVIESYRFARQYRQGM